jgi:hypothetical protein
MLPSDLQQSKKQLIMMDVLGQASPLKHILTMPFYQESSLQFSQNRFQSSRNGFSLFKKKIG